MIRVILFLTAAIGSVSTTPVFAAKEADSQLLSQDLKDVRGQIISVEKDLIQSLKNQSAARASISKTRQLLALQNQEKQLSRQRQLRLQKAIGEIETRRQDLGKRIAEQQGRIRGILVEIARSQKMDNDVVSLLQNEPLEAPRRKVLARLVDRSLREIETLKGDLVDADRLESQIEKERQQLDYLFQDISERESVLEFHKQLQVEILKENHQNRLSQLEKYRELKTTETKVEDLIEQFNERIRFEQREAKERAASRVVYDGEFEKQKGKLPLPVMGKVVSQFGRFFDKKLGLNVFRKGIEIEGGKLRPVKAVYPGKVVYAGPLNTYGQVTIVDHGAKYYTLCARMGRLDRHKGDWVAQGDSLGLTDEKGTALYYEIRSRNVAVNPLQWIGK